MKPLTVLWFGAGQDSTDLLYRYLRSKAYREQFIGDSHFIVIMSNTGDEFDFTYNHIDEIRKLCIREGVKFYFIEPWMGYHSQAWQSLLGQFNRNQNLMSVAFPKTCTDNLKIGPNYRFLADYLRLRYGYDAKGNRVFYQYLEQFGKLKSIIGFAKGKESRCGLKKQTELFPELVKSKDSRPLWMQRCVEHVYPLVNLGVNRAGCQESIKQLDYKVPMPSNCMRCPFAQGPELVFLNRLYPQQWDEWVKLEAAKIAKHRDQERNLGVKGEKLLPEVLKEELKLYGDWTTEMLAEYRMSHGHHVKSKI
ncbi:adenine nucleotide alpha hydrolase family protein [Spirosoma aerophilum]